MNKELFKKTEAILYDYNNLALKIELLKAEIKDIEELYKGCGAIGYEERTKSTNKFSSPVESEVLEKEKKLKMLRNILNDHLTLKRRIDIGIKILNHEESILLKMKYFSCKKYRWIDIANKISYNKDYCRKDIRNNVINKIAPFISSYI